MSSTLAFGCGGSSPPPAELRDSNHEKPASAHKGCGGSVPQTGERVIDFAGDSGRYILSLPSAYNANVPRPLVFAFHGYNRTHADCQATDCRGVQSVMGEEAVIVYPKSFTLGWEDPEIRDKNAKLFEAALDQVETEACIDKSKVFVMGTSSGASFTNLLACRYGDRIRGAGPVAGALPEEECKGNPAMVFIHGIDDPHVPFVEGEKAREYFLERNGCTNETSPPLAEVHSHIRAAREQGKTEQACVDYTGCRPESPVRWCEHSEGGYDGSTHGWPTEGGAMIWDFVKKL